MKVLLSLIMFMFLYSCTSVQDPIDKVIEDNAKYPSFSIQLIDMKEDTANSDFFHKYKVVYWSATDPTKPTERVMGEKTTGWMQAPKKLYNKYLNDLNMVVYSEDNGKVTNSPQPAGYQYVGNKQYGQWQTNSSGGSFWSFYGKYHFLRSMIGSGGYGYRSPTPIIINRTDYNGYQKAKASGRGYYGSKNQYGTTGSATKASGSKSFFMKRYNSSSSTAKNSLKARMQKSKSSSSSFKSRVSGKSRSSFGSRSSGSSSGRSGMSGFRGRSGGFGK